MEKFARVLQSRKFWMSVVGLLMSFGVYVGTDLDAETLVNAILVIVSTFVGSVAVEDGLHALARKRTQ